ncbi:MAG: choice-of-anchor M domain-containing protein, partial [Verrucomicrobiae bacterium]|nr:choice-of-anchor M domain-containing protein [Verrucomicrobiae bacterium]
MNHSFLAHPVVPVRRYSVTRIDVPGAVHTTAGAINESGTVAGEWYNEDYSINKGYLRAPDAGFTSIDPAPGYGGISVFALNNRGDIAGFMESDGYVRYGTTFTVLQPPGAGFTYARGLNDAGVVVGDANGASGNFNWRYDGTNFTTLEIPGASQSGFEGINNSGDTLAYVVRNLIGDGVTNSVGSHYLLRGTNFTDVTFPNATLSALSAVADNGTILGLFRQASTGARNRYFLYEQGQFVEIEFVGEPGWDRYGASGLNDAGQIAGTFQTSDDVYHGFIATPASASPTERLLVPSQFAGAIVQFGPNGREGIFAKDGLTWPGAAIQGPDGNIYISDYGRSIVVRYAPDGARLATVASDDLDAPLGMLFDPSGNLYVVNYAGQNVLRVAPDGSRSSFITNGLDGPVAIVRTAAGEFLVSNAIGNNIRRYSATGADLGILTTNVNIPIGLALDARDVLYVANAGPNGTITRFALDGSTLGDFATGEFRSPTGIAFATNGDLYAAGGNSVRRFSATGADLGVVGMGFDFPYLISFAYTKPILDTVHADVGVDYEDGEWNPHLHDETHDIEYAPQGAVIQVSEAARTVVPQDPRFGFLGAAGDPLWLLPQAQHRGITFLGMAADGVADGAMQDNQVKFTLVNFSGPGQFVLYGVDEFGSPVLFMNTRDGIDASSDFKPLVSSGHEHLNWAFTAPGVYRVGLQASGVLASDGQTVQSPVAIYTFNVLEGTPPVAVPFSRPITVGPGTNDYNVAVADLDGDGDLDVVSAASGQGEVLWSKNLGGGVYGPPILVGGGLGDPRAVATADLDGDGKIDILASNVAGLAVWFRNLGDGTFGPQQTITTLTPGSYYIGAADFDADGDADVLTTASDTGTVAWYANRLDEATHDFGPQQVLTTAADGAFYAAIADLDGDGDLDVLSASYNDNKVAWYENRGGTFGPQQVISTNHLYVAAVSVADFNQDGRPDVVVSGYSSVVGWFENLGGGVFGPQQVIDGNAPVVVTVTADLNQDGRPDVVGAGYDGQVGWYENRGNGFGPWQQIASQPGTLPIHMTTGDADGDGDTDIFVAEFRGNRVSWYKNQLGEHVNILTPPADATYPVGHLLEFSVYVGYPVTVNTTGGVPSLPFTIGSSAREAVYVAQPDPSTLLFRYTVQPGDVDADGIVIGGTIRLNGGTVLDTYGQNAPLDLPGRDTSGVRVNGNTPTVTGIRRMDANPTREAAVAYTVTFNKPVTGVDAADFALTTIGVVGAGVIEVSGSGETWTVSLNTGSGDGTIRLDVRGDATIADLDGNNLGTGFISGEVYTLRRAEVSQIDEFVTHEHLDLAPNYVGGAWNLGWIVDRDDGTEVHYAADEVLVVAEAAARLPRASGAAWDFLGVAAGEPVWVLPQTRQPGVPYPGIGAFETAADTFAPYLETDPRIDTAGRWIRVELVDLRGPDGGHFSLYSSDLLEPKVWMASADGITAVDAVWALPGTHAHYNWAFTARGNYEVDVVASGFLDANGNGTFDPGIDPYTESGVTTYYFQ